MIRKHILPRIERLESLIKRPHGGGSSTAGFTSFLWRPGGVVGGNVYTTWPTLVAAVAAVNGPRFIGVDTDLGVAIIPQGNWDFSPPGISGDVILGSASKIAPNTQVTTVTAPVTIHGLTGLTDNLVFINKSTVDVMTGTRFFFLDRGCTVFHSVAATPAAFIRAGGGANVTIFLSEFSVIGTFDGGVNAIQVGGGQCVIHVGEDCTIQPGMLLSPPGFLNVFLAGVDCQYGVQPAAPQVIPKGGRQTGVSAITNTGKTAAITTDDAGNPVVIGTVVRIMVTLNNPANDALTVKYGVLSADISPVPTPTGSFKISALTALGNGDVNVNDTSTLFWEVINPGP